MSILIQIAPAASDEQSWCRSAHLRSAFIRTGDLGIGTWPTPTSLPRHLACELHFLSRDSSHVWCRIPLTRPVSSTGHAINPCPAIISNLCQPHSSVQPDCKHHRQTARGRPQAWRASYGGSGKWRPRERARPGVRAFDPDGRAAKVVNATDRLGDKRGGFPQVASIADVYSNARSRDRVQVSNHLCRSRTNRQFSR